MLSSVWTFSLSVLSALVDRKILSSIYHFFDLCKTAVQIHHVVFLWITAASNVKVAVHSFTSYSLLDFCYFYYNIQLVQLQQQFVILISITNIFIQNGISEDIFNSMVWSIF